MLLEQNENKDRQTTCPVTGLPVLRRPEWTDRVYDKGYRLTTSLIGKQIVLNQPSGFGTLSGTERSLKHTRQVIDRYLDADKGYVHISDFSNMTGASFKARRFYAEFMKSRKNMVGLVYFGASPFLKLVIELGSKLFAASRINVRIVKDYETAVKLAVKMISGHVTQCSPAPLWVFSRKEKSREILSSHKWCLEIGDFSACCEVIDRRIFHPKTSGVLCVEHIEPLAKLREKIMGEVCRENGFDYIIADVTSIKSIGLRARRRFMASLKTWHHKNPIKAYVFYGAGGLIQAAISISKAFMPFKLMVAKDYDYALSLVEKDMQLKSGWLYFLKTRLFGGRKRRQKTPDDVKRLLAYIGDIDWEKGGIDSSIPVEDDHPFRAVFEAISLIKNELDDLFNEREKALGALMESERRFNEVLEHSRDILFKRDVRTGQYEYISKAVSRFLGYSPEQTKQMGYEQVKELLHPDDLEKFIAFSKRLLDAPNDNDSDYVVEYRMKNKAGGYSWFSDSHSVVRDKAGNPRFVISGNRDITAQKKAEAELKIAHERFMTVIDAIDAHIYVADMDSYQILMANRKMREDFGNSLIGQTCYKVFYGIDGPCDQCRNTQLLDKEGKLGDISSQEKQNPLTGRWYLNHDRAIPWGEKGRFVRLRIAIDITQMKQLQDERLAIEERMRRSQKLEAVATLAGGIAHNFNNLLMTVLGNLELARMHLPEDSRLLKNLQSSETAAKRAAELSAQMLTYVGQAKVFLRTLDLNTVAKEMAQALKTSVSGSYTLKCLPTKNPLLFRGDQAKIGQVITNLVTNSVESGISDPVDIIIRTDSQFCEKALLDRLSPNENLDRGDFVLLEVQDNGKGMEKEVAEKVFDPFFTTKFTGRGMGLAAVVGIMRAHHGAISIESRPGRGTRAKLFFPVEQEHTKIKEDGAHAAIDRSWKGSGLVLLVDDESHILEVGKTMLELLGFDVITACDGIAALEQLKKNVKQTVLVILDLTMPRKDGFETFSDILALDPDLPVIVSSGFAKNQVADRFTGATPSGFLKKPFQFKDLSAKIKAVLEKSTKADP